MWKLTKYIWRFGHRTFFEFKKSLLISFYNVHEKSIKGQVQVLSSYLDQNIQKYENILMGDYNARVL